MSGRPAPADFNFARLLAPIDVADFFANYYEKRPLLISRADPDYYAPLLDYQRVDSVITSGSAVHPDVFLVKYATDIDPKEYTLRDGRIDPARLYARFTDGATIALTQLQNRLPEMAALCRACEETFSTPFQTNIYFTPPGDSQGFRPHWDTHDVFVLQIAGTKHWRLYDTKVELPLPGQNFKVESDFPGEQTETFDMKPGSLFYCPRGLMHDAQTGSEPSLHITFGLRSKRWVELLLETVAAAALDDVALRHNVPAGFAQAQADRPALLAEIRRLLERVAASTTAAETALDTMIDDFLSTRRVPISGQLQQIFSLDAIDPQAQIRLRPHLMARLARIEDQVVLITQGIELAFPAFVGPALETLLTGTSLPVGQLPGLDATGATVLAKRLVREGLAERL